MSLLTDIDRKFLKGLLLGIPLGVLLTAAGLAIAAWVQYLEITQRMDERQAELRNRTRMILRPVTLPSSRPAGSLTEDDFGWQLTGIDGRPVSLSEYRGRTLVLNLWATWCGPCRSELKTLEGLRRSFEGDERLAFVMSSYEDAAAVRRYHRQHPHIQLDSLVYDQGVPQVLWPASLPTTFIIDCRGQIVVRHEGAADWDTPEVRQLLRALAEGCARDERASPGSSSPPTGADASAPESSSVEEPLDAPRSPHPSS